MILSLVIVILNEILIAVLKSTTLIEKYKIWSDYNISCAKKIAISQFVNGSLVTFIVQTFLQSNDKYTSLFSISGLVQNQMNVFIANAIVPVIIQLINIPYRVKKIKQHFAKRDNGNNLTQEEANLLFENPPFEIAEKYGAILYILFMTAFYAPIMPVCLLFSILALSFYYVCDKYILLNQCTVKRSLNFQLSVEMTEMLEFYIPIFSITQALFIYLIEDSLNILSLVALGIGVLHAILPMQLINKMLFKLPPPKRMKIPFSTAQLFMETDYDRENPATSETSI